MSGRRNSKLGVIAMRLRRFSLSLVFAGAVLLMAVGNGYAATKDAKNEYPNATRKDPKVEISETSQKQLTAAFKHIDENESDPAKEILTKVLEDKRASNYAHALALQALGQISWEKDDYTGAMDQIQQAIKLDALPNKSQFQAIYQLAQLYLAQEKYQQALDSISDWFKASGAETADAYALQANAYYRLDKFQDAINSMKKALSLSQKTNESWMQILMASYFELEQYDEASKLAQDQLAKDPNNKKLIQQLSSIYINAKQEAKALELMTAAKAKGLVTTEDDYKQLAQLYNYLDKSKEAAALLDEGINKGVMKPSYDLYKLQGDAYSLAQDDAHAIEAYGKASALAKDGNVDYLRGHLLLDADRSKEARDALTQAIAKGGLKQEGEAYILLGNAEYELGNTTAALAAYEKAKAYPSTKKMAEAWLKSAKAGTPIKKKK